MSVGKKPISGWGQKYSAFQLDHALQSNRGEFLELCKRVTCDENSANRLIGLVEQILNTRLNDGSKNIYEQQDELDKIKFEVHSLRGAGPIVNDTSPYNSQAIEDQTNLIQLLAEVHLMEISKKNKKIYTT